MARQSLLMIDNFYHNILNQLNTNTATLSQVQKAHAHILKTGHSNNTCLNTKLLSIYADHLCFSDAILVLDSIPEPDVFSFSTLISACFKFDRFNYAFRLLRQMLSHGLLPDNFVLPSMLKACAVLLALRIGQQLHSLASVTGFASDNFVQSSLVHMYVKCGKVKDAHKVFDRMTHRNVVSWSAIIAGYARLGYINEAKELFNAMRCSGIEPNPVSWNGLIAGLHHSGLSSESVVVLQEMHLQGFKPDGTSISSVLSAVGDLKIQDIGVQIHGYVIKQGLGSDKCVVSALLDMYGKCGCTLEMMLAFNEVAQMNLGSCNALVAGLARNGLVEDALSVFRQFKDQRIELNVVSWTSVISCCTQNGKDIEALKLFREMQVAGVEPNSVTIPCLLPACANIAALMHGKAAHCFSLRWGISDDVYVGSALIDMYAKCGKIGDARHFFDMMPTTNLVCWNAIVGGYSMHGKAKEAINLFDLMRRSGQKPDFISFTCVLSACSQNGLIEEGWYLFNSMTREHGIEARMEHYACMINLLSRVGRLEEAYVMIKEMPSEPDACVWGALLSSCRVYGNVSLGEAAADNLFKLEPSNPGNYVLLSNIYAANGMWREVDRVREMMKRMGLRKNPGCSWIEVKNKVHTLLAGDTSHPQMNHIIERLGRVSTEMKKLGYLPNTEFVLQDVEEQDKEQILCGHSEKLAVVVGLLNTHPGSPLRVIKNLRICGDCHVVIKFISSFEGREIFVRDTNRFHHFKDGVCSCGDYW
ncbi:pentatricopeptide repeat-containing protein At1g20230-like [Macadamia integrifolia]|uniref:pentatricopeptide repeat-containing protein At1g20230-like n=1 Tax=Macadamia integrifolia TaxID=60698 RepID=UPI001C4FACA3|nr:pentatricopeptide repeat-containing protein At1g20230-like [Macadamia integrifolia]XP_042489679.1 pentatricopeptide repeat-containing protein At1g20230-like [Macadamia integrifolia]